MPQTQPLDDVPEEGSSASAAASSASTAFLSPPPARPRGLAQRSVSLGSASPQSKAAAAATARSAAVTSAAAAGASPSRSRSEAGAGSATDSVAGSGGSGGGGSGLFDEVEHAQVLGVDKIWVHKKVRDCEQSVSTCVDSAHALCRVLRVVACSSARGRWPPVCWMQPGQSVHRCVRVLCLIQALVVGCPTGCTRCPGLSFRAAPAPFRSPRGTAAPSPNDTRDSWTSSPIDDVRYRACEGPRFEEGTIVGDVGTSHEDRQFANLILFLQSPTECTTSNQHRFEFTGV